MPCFRMSLKSVVRSMPRRRAASTRLPPVSASTVRTRSSAALSRKSWRLCVLASGAVGQIVWPKGILPEERAEIERLGTLIAEAARGADTSVLRALLARRMAELGGRVEEDRGELETTEPKREEEETPAIKSLIPRERLRELL